MNKFLMLAVGALCTAGLAVAGSYTFDQGAGLPQTEAQAPNGGTGISKAVSIQYINYELDDAALTATVTGCASTIGTLNIPASITDGGKQYTVTAVSANAFNANSSLSSITIPATITSVGSDAFRNVKNLRNLYINDLAAWCAIEFANGNANPIYNVFPTTVSQWGNVYVDGQAVTTLTIPEGVTSVGRAFYGFKALTSITFPSTLQTMGDQVLANCTGLTEVVIPEGVTSMGSVFFGCSELTNVTLPSTLKSLGNNVFYGCKKLTSIELPAGLESIGLMAFASCTGITEMTSHALVPPTVGMFAFDDLNKDMPVNVPETSIEDYKAAEGWSAFTNFVGFAVEQEPVNPFAPTGNEEVIGELQLLYHPTKDKVNKLEGAAQLGEGAEGWSMQCMNESKNLEQGSSITVNGKAYASIKTSNGAQNTVTLPEGYVANAVTIYSVMNADESETINYFREVGGVEYPKPDHSYLQSWKDFSNPDVSYFPLNGTNSFTFTNSGKQVLVVLVVDYSEYVEETSPFGDGELVAPSSVWPKNNAQYLPLNGTIKIAYPEDVTIDVYGNATIGGNECALAVENNVVTVSYEALEPSTEVTLTIPAKGIGNEEASNAEMVYTYKTAPADLLFYTDFNNFPYEFFVECPAGANKDLIAKNSTDKTYEIGGMTFFSGTKGRVVALGDNVCSDDPEADYGPYTEADAGATPRAVQLIDGGNGLYFETPEMQGPCDITLFLGNAGAAAGTMFLTDERGLTDTPLAELTFEAAKRIFKYTVNYPYSGPVKFRLYNQKIKVDINDFIVVKGEGDGIPRPEFNDTDAPVMTSVWPGTAPYAPLAGTVTVTYDEPVTVSGKATLNDKELDVVVEENTILVAYEGLAAGQKYTMTVPAVSDEAGNISEPLTVEINTAAEEVLYYTDFDKFPYSYFEKFNGIPNDAADNEDIIAKNSTDVTAEAGGITYYSGTNGRVVAMGKSNLLEADAENEGASARCIQMIGGEGGLYAQLPEVQGPCALTVYVGNSSGNGATFFVKDAAENQLAELQIPAEKKMYKYVYSFAKAEPVTLRIYNNANQINIHDILVEKTQESGLAAIEAARGEAVYYNLQGIRVDNPAAGLYIRVCGDKVEKVILR